MTLEDRVELAAWIGELHLSLREVARHAAGLQDEGLDFVLCRAICDTETARDVVEQRILDGGGSDQSPGAVTA